MVQMHRNHLAWVGYIYLLYILLSLVLEGRRPEFSVIEEFCLYWTRQSRILAFPLASSSTVRKMSAPSYHSAVRPEFLYKMVVAHYQAHIQPSPITKHFCSLLSGTFQWQDVWTWLLFLRLLPCMVELNFLTWYFIVLSFTPHLLPISPLLFQICLTLTCPIWREATDTAFIQYNVQF